MSSLRVETTSHELLLPEGTMTYLEIHYDEEEAEDEESMPFDLGAPFPCF